MLGNVSFNPDDGLYACRFRLLIKFNGAVKIPVIRDRKRFHPQLLSALDERVNFGETVEKRVMAVSVEMNEFRHVEGIIAQTLGVAQQLIV